MIAYSDVSISKPTLVTFSPASRNYDWSGLTTTGTFTLIMSGSIPGCIPVTSSFTVTVTNISSTFGGVIPNLPPSSTFGGVIPNLPPYFDSLISNLTLQIGKTKVFTFPSI